MSREFKVGSVVVNDASDCFVIAEIGHNHQGNVDQCKALIKSAVNCGATAVKLQKRDNKSLFTSSLYDSAYASENAFGATYGEHREFLEFGWDEFVELKRYSEELGTIFFSTAFDFKSVDFLEKLGVPAYKVASGDLSNLPLLRYIASTGKPMIISTGGGDMEDVVRAYDTVGAINKNFCILQCTAGYPPEWPELNLRVITTFRERFPDIQIGLSSHDNGIAMSLVAYMLGARVVEKHFTLSRAMKGTDHAFSLEHSGLEKMIRDLRRARIALGDGVKQRYPSEAKPMMKMGKKLVASRALPAGHVLTAADIDIKSPNDGLSPRFFDDLVGKTLKRPLSVEENITFEDVEATAGA